jgi:hypothetical protein
MGSNKSRTPLTPALSPQKARGEGATQLPLPNRRFLAGSGEGWGEGSFESFAILTATR